jgi:hypothetical protein
MRRDRASSRIAEQAAAEAPKLGKSLDIWLAVVAEIKRIQKTR